MTEIPEIYQWKLSDWNKVSDGQPYYWIGEDPLSKATPLYTVDKAWLGGQTTIAMRCYLPYAIEIVNALRAVTEIKQAVGLYLQDWEREL